jgi:hypothetical protein
MARVAGSFELPEATKITSVSAAVDVSVLLRFG